MTRTTRDALIAIAVLLAIIAAWAATARAQQYTPDHIDLERHANWKALRSHDCFWYGRRCPGRRHWRRHRHYAPLIRDDAACHERTEATGDQAQSRENAEAFALRSWQGRVRFKYGERYIDFGNARDARIVCSPSSVADTVGGKIQEKLLNVSHFRCEISARPCRAVARPLSGDDD